MKPMKCLLLLLCLGAFFGGCANGDVKVSKAHLECRPRRFMMEKVHFRTCQSDLSEKQQIDVLDEMIRELKTPTMSQERAFRINIEGNTNSWEARHCSKSLGLKRAESVKQYLIQHQLEASKWSVEDFRSTRPIASDHTRTGRAHNRRADVIVHFGSEKLSCN